MPLFFLLLSQAMTAQDVPAVPGSARKPSAAPESGSGPPGKFRFETGPEGISLEELLAAWTEVTGHRFSYHDADMRGKPKVRVSGDVEITRNDADHFFQSLIVQQGFALVRAGPPDADLYLVTFIPNSGVLKSSAAFVDREQIPSLSRRPAEVFATSFQLQHIRADQLRTALTQIMTNRVAELMAETSPKSITVIGFGPTLASIDGIIRATDRPENAPEPPPAPAPEKPRGDGR